MSAVAVSCTDVQISLTDFYIGSHLVQRHKSNDFTTASGRTAQLAGIMADSMGAYDARPRKRSRSASPQPPWRKQKQERTRDARPDRRAKDDGGDDDIQRRREQETFAREQTKINSQKESEQMREWVSQEDTFVLKQAKKKAEIRVKEGRAKPIDYLAVNLRVIDTERDPLEDEIDDADLDIVDPEGVFEGLDERELETLEKDIDVYLSLETNKNNQEYWSVGTFFLDITPSADFRRL